MTEPYPLKKPPIKALIFDVGDILYDASLWRRWLAVELSRFVEPEVTYARLVETWERFLVPVYKAKQDYWSAFEAMLSEFGLDEKDHPALIAKAKAKGQAVQVDRAPMPEVPDTLAALHSAGIKLIALSDNESGEAGVRKTLNQLGIEQYFDAVVSSFSIGHVKPEPEAFDYAIEQSGVPKENCGFVAHDIDELEGAQNHNLFAIGYNYHPDAPADVFIENFAQLIGLTEITGGGS